MAKKKYPNQARSLRGALGPGFLFLAETEGAGRIARRRCASILSGAGAEGCAAYPAGKFYGMIGLEGIL